MDQQTTTAAPVQAPAKLSPVLNLIKKTLNIYKNGISRFVGMMLIPILGILPLIAVVCLYFASSIFLSGVIQTVVNVVIGILGIAAIIIMIIVYISAHAGMIFLVKNFEAGQKTKEAFLEGRKYAWKFFVVSLLTVIFVVLWGFLFIIPGIIFAIYYSLSAYTLVNEGFSGRAALKRSKELVKGYWWAVAWRLIALSVLWLAVYMILYIPVVIIGEKTLIGALYDYVLSCIDWIVTVPVFTIYSFLIYKELVGVKAQKTV